MKKHCKANTCGMLSLLLLLMSPEFAVADQGDWLVRLRGIAIVPNDDSGLIALETGGTSTPLSGSGVTADASFVPELDVTYMFHKNWGLEVIAGIANHDVNLSGPGPVLAGLGLTDNFKIFDTWVLPPTVTLQYHFMPDKNIRPYAGFGVNYTAFLWDDATDGLESVVGPVAVNTDNGWTWAAQVGVDIDLNDRWYFNLDLKYINIDTTASLFIKNGGLAGTGLRVDLDVDPFVVGGGIGLRF